MDSHIRFELLNLNLEVMDELHPVADSVPRVDYDKSRKIKRTLSGLALTESDYEKIDPFAQLIRPVWDNQPVGAYIPADVTTRVTTSGPAFSMGNCDDLSGYFDEETRGGGVATDGYATEAMKFIVGSAGISQMKIESSPLRPYTPMLWEPGEIRGQMVDDCALAANQWWYFDNQGAFVSRSIVDPGNEAPDHSYAPGDGLVVGDFYESRSILRKAPNTYVVVNTGASDIEVSGTFRIPAECPHSFENRGREVLRVIPMQGVSSVQDATEKAWLHWLADDASYEYIEFDTIPVPSHDCFAVVSFAGVNYLEIASSLELVPNGNHHHVIARKVW